MSRNAENLSRTINQHLQRNNLHQNDPPPWEIRKSSLGGYGIFATRPIQPGEEVFTDAAVILGPRAAPTCPEICASCYTPLNLQECVKKCGLKLCKSCQGGDRHTKECKVIREWHTKPISGELCGRLTKVLAPIRSLLLGEDDREVVRVLKAHRAPQHGFEVDVMKTTLGLNVKEDEETFMRLVCSVLDSNAFEVVVGSEGFQSSVKGLYPLASLANHSCTPNTIHVFDSHQRMVVTASSLIPENAEVFHSYSRLVWGTATRRFHLYKTKHFFCRCERCMDPTEFGSFLSAIYCKVCKSGFVVPIDPLARSSKWQCNVCFEVMAMSDVAGVMSLLGAVVNSFSDDDVNCMLKFLNVKLPQLAPQNNQAAVEVKCKIIWILGHREGFAWSELTDELIETKRRFCEEILDLLDILRMGQCKMRGLILYELYLCQKEIKRRSDDTIKCDGEMKKLLQEASVILRDDVGAPFEIKAQWIGH